MSNPLTANDVRDWLVRYPDDDCRVTRSVAHELIRERNGRLTAKGAVREFGMEHLGAGVYRMFLKELQS